MTSRVATTTNATVRILDAKAGSQKKINLASLLRLNPEAVDYAGLKAAVARAASV